MLSLQISQMQLELYFYVPNSKTICPLTSTLKFNLYKCGKWSFIISYDEQCIHLTYYIRYLELVITFANPKRSFKFCTTKNNV